MITRKIVPGALAAVAAGTGYLYETDEGTRRSFLFWKDAFPIYVHYRYVQWKVKGISEEEADAEYNKLHDRYAPEVEALTLRLKGAPSVWVSDGTLVC